MKTIINKLRERMREKRAIRKWRERGYLENTPQSVKENIFMKYAVKDAPWIETGTHMGTTTDFLERRFPKVYSIEPARELFDGVVERFRGRNIELFNDVSECVFPVLLPRLEGSFNFWLDGHYSAGITFKGNKNCPVEDELRAIKNNLSNFDKVTILIDDVRCFLQIDPAYSDYPSIDALVDWARENGFAWRIEQDIFVMINSG